MAFTVQRKTVKLTASSVSVWQYSHGTPYICNIQSHPPELVWAEHQSPSTCGRDSCLQLIWLVDISLPHIIPCMFWLNPLWLVMWPDCGLWLSHYTKCGKPACSCCQFVEIVSTYSDDIAVFTDRLYKTLQLWLDYEDWISSCDLHRFSTFKYEVFLNAYWRRCHHPVGHTHLTWTFAAWTASTHLSTSCYMS